jgi:ketopantoate reductase
MNDLITVFRMSEIPSHIRASIIIKLGKVINDQYAAHITESLVSELVSVLDKDRYEFTDGKFPKILDTSRE